MTISFDAPDSRHGHNSGQNRRQERKKAGSGGKTERKFPDISDSLLTKVIEGEIIPRLFLAHSNPVAPSKQPPAHLLSCEAFARLVLVSETDAILADVESLLESGVTLEQVFGELLAPVARQLGDFWLEDVCSFTEVTLGLSRLHSVLHEISRRHAASPFRASSHRAFFAPVPGEQHTFGISMLEEFFHQAGWETNCDHIPTVKGILERVATQSLDIIGFSIGCQEFLDPLSDLIEKTRKASCNPDMTIMVGGSLFAANPALAARFGNATIVADGASAVRVAEDMVSRLYHSDQARKFA